MKNRLFAGLLLAGVLAAPIAAQMPDSYLDVYTAKVKMGKRAEFGVYYITNLVKSLGDLDKIKPLQEVLGPAYASYQKFVAESIAGTEVVIGRFLPELSNPPAEVVVVDPKFWRSPPPPASKPATN
jgi:hypothetical protein